MLLGTSVSAYLIPAASYQADWKTPKYFDTQAFLYVIYAVLAFAGGGILVASALPRVTHLSPEVLIARIRLPWRALRVIFYITFVAILFAYIIWLFILLHHGVSLSILASGLKGDPGTSYQIRGDPGARNQTGGSNMTLPGVTTLTQLASGFFILGFVLIYKFGWRKNLFALVLPMLFILFITWIRSRLWSERLAVLELLIPSVILSARLVRSEKWKLWLRGCVAAAPLAAPLVLFIFFSAAEYSRSWISYYSERQDSFFLFSFMRLVGYYVTALNNGALAVQAFHHYPVPYYTVDWFWRLPGIKTLLPYEIFAHTDPNDYFDLLNDRANPEFNNPSGIFVVRLDYGYIGGLCAWFTFGVIATLLYRSFIKGGLVGFFLYPFFFIGLLEAPRIFYWGEARGLPTWGLLSLILCLALFTSQALRPTRHIREGIVRDSRRSLPGSLPATGS